VNRVRIPHTRTGRLALVGLVAGVLALLLLWRGPELALVGDAFGEVEWRWVLTALAMNVLSVVVRSSAWRVVIKHACAAPWPSRRTVFSAFSVGLLGNAVLPGRVGELARVAVVTRRLRRPGAWPALVGTVFTHRLFDVIAIGGLVLYVLYTARIPNWAEPALGVFIGVGAGLLIASLLLARRQHRPFTEELGPIRRVLRTARYGLNVLRQPLPAVEALAFQLLGWTAQLFAVWAAFRAFGIDEGFAAAGLVLLIMNVVTVFPFWPGNVGLVQAAVALVLLRYGVDYAHGFAYGIGLQAIEASVGVLLGLAFLAREGFSFAMLRRMPEVTEVQIDDDQRVERIA
jgi:glycosyltransferase 2 family protein